VSDLVLVRSGYFLTVHIVAVSHQLSGSGLPRQAFQGSPGTSYVREHRRGCLGSTPLPQKLLAESQSCPSFFNQAFARPGLVANLLPTTSLERVSSPVVHSCHSTYFTSGGTMASKNSLKTPKGTRDWVGGDLVLRDHIL
jgi:hypothetical protein